MSRALKRRTIFGIAAAAAALTAISVVIVPASAAPDDGSTIPGIADLPALPGIPGTGGSAPATMGADGRTNINLPLVPQGGVRKQFTNAPAVEQSTNPACAPFVLVAVPGTFEINRDDDPNTSVGMLKKLADPLKESLGDKLSITSINYDADAGVNGTGYAQSTDSGVKKTLATIVDVANRCQDATVMLTGFSQGADIVGDVATDIGQKRTPVDPKRIGGVALFSDPKRQQNTNVVAGTNQSQPSIPQILQGAIDKVTSDPSFAQLQMNVTSGVESLLSQYGPSAEAGTDNGGQTTPSAGQSLKTTAPSAGQAPNSSPSAGSKAPSTSTDTSGSNEDDTTTPRTPPPAGSTRSSDGAVAGASANSDGPHIQLIEDISQLTSAADQLAPVEANGQAPEGVTSIGSPDGEWLPIEGLTPADIETKATQKWVYGRTDADKDARRSVVTDLYLYGWDGCTEKTLQQCLQENVDGVDNNETAPGILTPSTELTATRDQLGATASPPRPDTSDYSSCLLLTVSDCTAKLKVTQAKNKDRETKRDASTFTDELANEILPKISSIKYSDTDTVPVEVMGKRMENPDASNDKDPNNNVTKGSQLNQCTTKLEYPQVGHGVDPQAKRNEWLMQAWKVVSDPKPKEADRANPEWSDKSVVGCFPWAARVINEVEKQYTAGTLIYDDPNFVAPNTPTKLSGGEARDKLISELFAYGGCGDAALTDGGTAAPDGTWSLATCRQELNVPEGTPTEATNADLGPAQLQVAVALARDAYTANRPKDWTAEAFQWADMSTGGSPRPIVEPSIPAPAPSGPQPIRWSCDQFSARVCAIMKTPITGPEADEGATEMVKPTYPTLNVGTGETILGDAPSAFVDANAADPDHVNKLKADGYLWATPEVKANVVRLDEARHAAQGGQARYKAPDNDGSPVNWIINKDGATAAVDDLEKAELHRRLDTGWAWGYTNAEKEDRTKLVDSLYTYGGCYDDADQKQLTYNECKSAFLQTDPSKVSPAFAIPNADIEKRVSDGKEAGKVNQLDFDPTTVPDDLNSCKDKVVGDCAERVTEEAPPTETGDAGKDPANNAAAVNNDETGDGQSSGTTSTGAPNTPVAQGDSEDEGTADSSTSEPTSGTSSSGSSGSSTTSRKPAVAGDSSSSPKPAGAGSTTTSGSRAGGSSTSSTSTNSTVDSDVDADGGLANKYADLITDSAEKSAPGIRTEGNRVQVTPITQHAVAGGGLAGQRESDFGELQGRVVSMCVAGDLVCSMPPDSQIATDLVTFAQNVSLDFPDMLGSEGATRMGGLLALQALNTVTDTTGLPRTKLSAESLQAMIDITAGAAMLAAQNPAGTALVAKGVGKLPKAIPELFDQLKDVPSILEKLPTAPQTAAERTGLDDVLARVSTAFTDAGMENPLQIDKLPQAIPAVMTALAEDNTGLVELVTNPQYWQPNAHGQYPELKVAGSTGSIDWVAQWVDQLSKLTGGGR